MIQIGAIVIRVDDLELQARFWEAALDYVRRGDDDDDFIHLLPKDGSGPHVSLDRLTSEGQVRPRIHLDLYTDKQSDEVDRLVGLGATRIPWTGEPKQVDYVILADPEGNRFCVIDKGS